MSENRDGGAAFPQPRYEDGSFPDHYGFGGMSLLDYYIGQALAGLCANSEFWDTPFERIAKHAVCAADAVLAERARRAEEGGAMKDEPWRGNPGLHIRHLEEKLTNKKTRLAQLERLQAEHSARVAELERLVEAAYRDGFTDGHIEGAGFTSMDTQEDAGWDQSDARAALAAMRKEDEA